MADGALTLREPAELQAEIRQQAALLAKANARIADLNQKYQLAADQLETRTQERDAAIEEAADLRQKMERQAQAIAKMRADGRDKGGAPDKALFTDLILFVESLSDLLPPEAEHARDALRRRLAALG